MASANQFLSTHLGQLMSIGFPEDIIPNLYSKLLPNLVFDAGEVFVFSERNGCEGRGRYDLIAKTDMKKHSDVFLVDHAWTNDGGMIAKQQLEKMPQLLYRMQNMFALPTIDGIDENDEDYYESKDVISKMCSCSLNEAGLALSQTNNCIIDAITHMTSENRMNEELHHDDEDETQCSYEDFKKAISACTPQLSAADVSESYLEKMYAGFLKQQGKGVGAGITSNYNWTDDMEDGFVYVNVAIEANTRKQEINSQLSSSHWKLEVENMGNIIDGDLAEKVLADESYWSIESPGVLCMALRKKSNSEKLWTELITGEKQLSAAEIKQAAWNNEVKTSIEIKEVLDSMWFHNQTYSIGTASDQVKKQAPKWYVMDEVGCSMQHSSEPNFACLPFFFLNKGLALSLIWPLKDIKRGDVITRNFVPKQLPGESHANHEIRASIIITNSTEISQAAFSINQHQMSYQSMTDKISLADVSINDFSITKRTFYCDYIDFDSFSKVVTKSGCSATDTVTDADVLLLHRQLDIDSIKHSALVSHFINEELLFVKDQFAKYVHDHFGYPSWFPKSFSLQKDLNQLIASISNESKNNHWIIRTTDSSKIDFEPVVTADLVRISRLAEAGNVIASEFCMLGPLYEGRKFALSYSAIIIQTQSSLEMYIHKQPYIRTASKPFNSSKMFDEYDTSSLITKKPKSAFDKTRQQDFVDFEKEMSEAAKKNNPDCTWKDIEKEIFSCSGVLFNSIKENLLDYDKVKSFSLVGIDFMLNSKFQPVLLGIDPFPTFASDVVLSDALSTIVSAQDKNKMFQGDSLVQVVSA